MKPEDSKSISSSMDQFHLMVGRILSQYSFLDQVINSIIWRLSGIDPRVGVCLTSQISTQSKIKVMYHLLALRDGSNEIVAELRKLESKNHDISKIRNRLAHDPILWNDENKSVESLGLIPLSGQSDKIFSTMPLDMTEMNNILLKISKHMRGFVDLHKLVDGWLADNSPGWRQGPGSFELGDIDYVE